MTPAAAAPRPAWGAADVALAAASFSATVLYVVTWPRDLVPLDEGLFVYEAARILDGEIPYRDFFEMVTPGAWYLLALLYRVFGVDLATARGMMAVVHGLIVVAVYAACRRLGVRRGFSAVAAAFHMAAGYPTVTFASPHWISTLLMLAALHVALGYRAGAAAGRAFVLGVIGAAAVAVQQQKGVWLLLGLACFVALRETLGGRRRVAALAVLCTGAALVLLPLGACLLAAAGYEPLVRCLVRFPLTGYRAFHVGMSWGMSNPFLPSYQPFPLLMKWMPVVIPLLAVRALLGRRRGEPDAAARGLLLVVFCFFSILGIAYNPGYTHLAMIAPVYSIAAAELAETMLGFAPIRTFARPAGLAASGLLLMLLAAQMHDSRKVRRHMFWLRAETRFGAVDFMGRDEVEQIEALAERMRSAGREDLFIYPHHAAVYLMTGTRNPTPFQLMLPNYNTPEQFAELMRILDAKKVRYIALLGGLSGGNRTPFWRYVTSHYRRVALGRFEGRRSPLFERIETVAPQPRGADTGSTPGR